MDYEGLIQKSIRRESLSREEAAKILATPDEEIDKLLEATYQVRKHFHGNNVKLCMLLNAQSGFCSEDCRYCSQSKLSAAQIEKYPLRCHEELLDGARRADECGAKRYCMVTSGKGPTEKYLDRICKAVREIRTSYPLEICCSLGILSEAQAMRLKDAGVNWINHNLNTSERFHPQICTTHQYQDRVATIRNVAKAGMKTCSGCIVGMGESDEDIIDIAYAARSLDIDSIPINFLMPIPGIPLENLHELTLERCLKVLCLFRFIHPDKEIRAAGGREFHLGDQQYQALYAVNSIFVDGYLTTPGMGASDAIEMIRSHGFEVELEQVESCGSLQGMVPEAEQPRTQKT